MTPDLLRFLVAQEGFKPKAYFFSLTEQNKGIVTFGFGSTLTLLPGQTISQIPDITVERAMHIMRDYLSDLETKLRKKLKDVVFLSLKPNELDAILSLCYNGGPGVCPKLLKCLTLDDKIGASRELMNIIYQKTEQGVNLPLPGLCYRRASEYDMFTKGAYKKRDGITAVQRDVFLTMNKAKDAQQVIKGLMIQPC